MHAKILILALYVAFYTPQASALKCLHCFKLVLNSQSVDTCDDPKIMTCVTADACLSISGKGEGQGNTVEITAKGCDEDQVRQSFNQYGVTCEQMSAQPGAHCNRCGFDLCNAAAGPNSKIQLAVIASSLIFVLLAFCVV